MPKKTQELREKTILNAIPRDRDYKLYDREGLCIVIRKTGKKVWQYHYQHQQKRKTLTIGNYYNNAKQLGHISLKDARMRRYEAAHLLSNGIDPNEHKKNVLNNLEGNDCLAFEAVGREWHKRGVWVPKHAKNILRSLEDDVFPFIGRKPIDKINARDIVEIIERIEEREAYDVAKRVCQRCAGIFDYAINKGLCENNPAIGRAKFVKKVKVKPRSHFKEHELPNFLCDLSKYHGRDYIKIAMLLLVQTFLRPGELRHLEWGFVDFEAGTINLPAHVMKMKREHYVPLSKQSLALLMELHEITGDNTLLFPSILNHRKPISEVTLTKVLRVMGYSGEQVVPHGMRHTASTILNERGFNFDHIEKQLAHVQENKVRGAYNHAQYLDARREMMQWYADHLDELASKHDRQTATCKNTLN